MPGGVRKKKYGGSKAFAGHTLLPADDYTVVPNYFFDVVMPLQDGSEWKITCCTLRQTLGWWCGDPAHPKTCRRLWFEISVDDFERLTGLAREAASGAIIRAQDLIIERDANRQPLKKRDLIKRRPNQRGRARSYLYSAVIRGNISSVAPAAEDDQQGVLFASEFENRIPNTASVGNSETESPTTASEFGDRIPNAPVLIDEKKDLEIKKHTHVFSKKAVCVGQSKFTKPELKRYARQIPAIFNPVGWANKAFETGTHDDDVEEYYRHQEHLIIERDELLASESQARVAKELEALEDQMNARKLAEDRYDRMEDGERSQVLEIVRQQLRSHQDYSKHPDWLTNDGILRGMAVLHLMKESRDRQAKGQAA